ncbi:MAG: hypothetical protein HW397_591 [Dehalococcoidia bacterium]|nr:hypothetical protein [Dehalococcoidia bacterium]
MTSTSPRQHALIDYRPLDQAEAVRAIFYPQRQWTPAPSGTSDHRITVAEGIGVSGRFYPFYRQSPNILLFHGNGEVACHYDDLAMHYHEAGANLFVADYRGYGLSGGAPSFASMMADAHAVYRYFADLLRAEAFTSARFIKGRSLGSQSALVVAASFQDQLAGLIIESGFAGAERLFERLHSEPPIAARETMRLHREKLKTIGLPLLVIHGEEDDIVPVEHAADLYDAVGSADKDLLLVPHAGHNDLLYVDPHKYFMAMRAFVTRHRRDNMGTVS